MVIKMNKILTIGITLIMLIAVMGAGCLESTDSYTETTTGKEAALTESNQVKLLTANPPPSLDRSLERENLINRLELLNNQNKIFYVYLVSYGKVMAEYTAKGKVSSVNSKLTTQEQIVEDPHSYYRENQQGVVVESPDLDGSYGTNGDGIFFFTTDGAYVEWSGEYFVSDFPLSLSTPPVLVRTLNTESKQVVEN